MLRRNWIALFGKKRAKNEFINRHLNNKEYIFLKINKFNFTNGLHLVVRFTKFSLDLDFFWWTTSCGILFCKPTNNISGVDYISVYFIFHGSTTAFGSGRSKMVFFTDAVVSNCICYKLVCFSMGCFRDAFIKNQYYHFVGLQTAPSDSDDV